MLGQQERWGRMGCVSSHRGHTLEGPITARLVRRRQTFWATTNTPRHRLGLFWVISAGAQREGAPRALNVHTTHVPAAHPNLETWEELHSEVERSWSQVFSFFFSFSFILFFEPVKAAGKKLRSNIEFFISQFLFEWRQGWLTLWIYKPALLCLLRLRRWREDPAPFTQWGPSAPSCWSLGSDWSWLEFFKQLCTIV